MAQQRKDHLHEVRKQVLITESFMKSPSITTKSQLFNFLALKLPYAVFQIDLNAKGRVLVKFSNIYAQFLKSGAAKTTVWDKKLS